MALVELYTSWTYLDIYFFCDIYVLGRMTDENMIMMNHGKTHPKHIIHLIDCGDVTMLHVIPMTSSIANFGL